MLLSFPQHLASYLRDVFFDRADLWFIFGLVAQTVFAGRFLIQWIESEREGRSVVPVAFWILSIIGGSMTLLYGVARHDAIIILGQVLSNVVYIRNLMLIAKSRRAEKMKLD